MVCKRTVQICKALTSILCWGATAYLGVIFNTAKLSCHYDEVYLPLLILERRNSGDGPQKIMWNRIECGKKIAGILIWYGHTREEADNQITCNWSPAQVTSTKRLLNKCTYSICMYWNPISLWKHCFKSNASYPKLEQKFFCHLSNFFKLK